MSTPQNRITLITLYGDLAELMCNLVAEKNISQKDCPVCAVSNSLFYMVPDQMISGISLSQSVLWPLNFYFTLPVTFYLNMIQCLG